MAFLVSNVYLQVCTTVRNAEFDAFLVIYVVNNVVHQTIVEMGKIIQTSNFGRKYYVDIVVEKTSSTLDNTVFAVESTLIFGLLAMSYAISLGRGDFTGF